MKQIMMKDFEHLEDEDRAKIFDLVKQTQDHYKKVRELVDDFNRIDSVN